MCEARSISGTFLTDKHSDEDDLNEHTNKEMSDNNHNSQQENRDFNGNIPNTIKQDLRVQEWDIKSSERSKDIFNAQNNGVVDIIDDAQENQREESDKHNDLGESKKRVSTDKDHDSKKVYNAKKENLNEDKNEESDKHKTLGESKKVSSEKDHNSKKDYDATKEISQNLSEDSKDIRSSLINEVSVGTLTKTVTRTTNEDVVQHRNGESSIISYESGGKPPKNTPAHTIYGSEPDGKVQPMYVRFPGQRHGLMMFAEMNQQAGKVRIVGRDKEKEMLARLSWLLLDAGTSALRLTFDSIHPPAVLREHLTQTHVKAILDRLKTQGIIDDKQWKLLYPLKKKVPTSQKFDSRILVTLLETICHLCPPYPNGWSREPFGNDNSLSADIVRLQLLFMELTRHETIPGEVYAVLFAQIRDVLLRLGGPSIRIKIARIEQELISLDMQPHYIQTLRDMWQGNVAKKLDKIHDARTKTSRLRKVYTESKGVVHHGLSPEDRVTLTKTYKLFVDHIPAEDVLDRLQQSQVIKFSDRQEILAHGKRSERITLLLEKIMQSKLPYALKALIDAIKFKYKKVYEQVMLVRKATHKEGVVTKIDTVGITQETLKNYYRTYFSRIYPFPWSETIHASVRDLFSPLDIVDSNGNQVHQTDLLPPPSLSDRGLKILLEGSSGSGKSMLCQWIAYMWAVQPQFFKNRYQQLLYLNAHELQGNLESAIYRKLLPDNFKLSIDQFWNMLETKSHEVLVLLDGFDQSDSVDVSDILAGTRLLRSTVIMTVNPDHCTNLSFTPDRRWFNLGLSEASVKRCLKTCVAVSRLDQDPFERFYKFVLGDKWILKKYLAVPILAVKIFAIFYVLRKGTILKEMKTECDILEKYGVAMAALYCKRNKIDIDGFEFPDEILSAVVDLYRFAYTCLIENRITFREEEVLRETNNPIVLKLGAFVTITQGSNLKFSCGVTRDFLAAKYIADMTYADLETTLLQYKMFKLPRYVQVMSFLCGQYRNDHDTPVLRALFEHLAARNEYCIRGNHLPDEHVDAQPGPTVIVKRDMSHGVLRDFKTSLHCLTECPEREEALETISQSLPKRLIVKIDGVLMLKLVEGLSLVLGHADCPVAEIVIDLSLYHLSQLSYFMQLASAIGQKQTIKTLKVTWASLDMMAMFLAEVTSNSTSLENVVLREDRTSHTAPHVSAATWAALQSSCSSMVAVKKMAFLGVRSTAVVNLVLQHIPTTTVCLDLTGCAMNLMCAAELSCHLHGNTAVQVLDLSYTNLNSAEFVAIIHGLQLCECIKHIRLRGTRFDRTGVVALSEFLRLTHSLTVLDLSNCQLTTDMCLRLAAGMKQNRSLTKVILKNTQVTSEGQRMFTGSTLDRLVVEGLPKTGPLTV